MNINNRFFKILTLNLLILSFGKTTANNALKLFSELAQFAEKIAANNILKSYPELTSRFMNNIAGLNQSRKTLAIAFKQNQDLASPDVKAALEQVQQKHIQLTESIDTVADIELADVLEALDSGKEYSLPPYFYETYRNLATRELKVGAEEIEKEHDVDIHKIYYTDGKKIYPCLNPTYKKDSQ